MSLSMMIATLLYIGVVGGSLAIFAKKRDLLAPEILTSLSFLVTMPYLFFASLSPESAAAVSFLSQATYEATFPIVVIIQALVYCTVILGIFVGKKGFTWHRSLNTRRAPQLSALPVTRREVPSLEIGLAVLMAGFAVMLSLVLNTAGSVAALWGNINMRMSFLAGSGLDYMVATMLVNIGLSIVFLQTICQKRRYVIFAVSLALGLFSVGVFGARSPVIQSLILLVFLHHYFAAPLKLSAGTLATFVPPAVVVFVFIAAIAAVRTLHMNENNPNAAADLDTTDAIMAAILHMSHMNTYIFIFDYFNISNIWLGASYRNLYLFAESYFLGLDRVTIDDGVYVLALMLSGTVHPNQLLKDMFPSSTPPYLWFGFMQFHFIGLFFFALIQGWVKGRFYVRFVQSRRSLLAFFLMYEVGYSFSLTTHAILRCMLAAVFYYLVFAMLEALRKMSAHRLR